MEMKATRYGTTTTVDGPFQEVAAKVKETFKKHGFGTMSEIDVQALLRDKTGQAIEPYTIVGICNPDMALRAITAEHEVGLLMPCNVLVHECGGKVHVSLLDAVKMLAPAKNEALTAIAEEARSRMSKALAEIGGV
jgi:uncharacterized protein (DUF302 family)